MKILNIQQIKEINGGTDAALACASVGSLLLLYVQIWQKINSLSINNGIIS